MNYENLTKEELLLEIKKLKNENDSLQNSVEGVKRENERITNDFHRISQNFDYLLESSPEGIIITRFDDGKILKVNKTLLNITGYVEEDLLNKNILHFSDRYDEAIRKDITHIIEKGGAIYRYETVFKKKDETEFYCELSAHLFYANNTKKIITYVRDVTEQKQNLELIKKSENKYKILAENIKDVIWVLNPKTFYFTYVSPSIYNLRGFTPEEVMAEPLDSALTTDGTKFAKGFISQKIKQYENVEVIPPDFFRRELQQIHKNGSLIWTEIISVIYRNVETGELEIRGVTRDITERKQIESELNKSLAEYKILFDNASETIVVLQDGFIKKFNNKAMELSGYTEEELITTPFVNFVHKDDVPIVLNSHVRRLKGEEFKEKAQMRLICKDGAFLWTEVSGIRINWEGRFATLNFLTDINDRKIAEEQILLKNEELISLNKQKDKLFSIISHDLRNPMHVILGLSDMLVSGIEQYEKNEIKNIVNEIKKSGKRLSDLLENILKWTRLQQGLVPFSDQEINFSEMLEVITQSFVEPANLKNIKLTFSIRKRVFLTGDVNLIDSLFSNLISNAIKFTREHGEINIELSEKGEELIVRIKDNGIGMNDRMLNKLFILGEKIQRQGTNKEPSTGLGLQLSKYAADKHEAKIVVESNENEGTSFIVAFPKSKYTISNINE